MCWTCWTWYQAKENISTLTSGAGGQLCAAVFLGAASEVRPLCSGFHQRREGGADVDLQLTAGQALCSLCRCIISFKTQNNPEGTTSPFENEEMET